MERKKGRNEDAGSRDDGGTGVRGGAMGNRERTWGEDVQQGTRRRDTQGEETQGCRDTRDRTRGSGDAQTRRERGQWGNGREDLWERRRADGKGGEGTTGQQGRGTKRGRELEESTAGQRDDVGDVGSQDDERKRDRGEDEGGDDRGKGDAGSRDAWARGERRRRGKGTWGGRGRKGDKGSPDDGGKADAGRGDVRESGQQGKGEAKARGEVTTWT